MDPRRAIAEVLRDPQGARSEVACQAFIDQVLKPRFLPEVRPTEFNYPIDFNGRWHGSNYRFIQRYRSGFVDNAGWEFDALHPPRIRRRRSFPPFLPSPHRPVASPLLRSFAFPGPEPDRERRTPTSALSARTPAQLLVRLTSSDGAPILWPH